jgi:hypothetical protein
MSQTKAQLVSGTTAQDLTVDNINTTSINSGQPSGRKNLIINGAMQVAQRSTSSTSTGYQTVDRFSIDSSGLNENLTQAQVDVASGTTPYTLGFRKALKITNGNQTGGAGAADYANIQHKFEAQDVSNSGWNYISSSSDITISFWVKSSVAQTFYAYLRTKDGTNYHYPCSFALSADTWTKVTKTISGNSNLQIDNDNGEGMQFTFMLFYGTNYTSSGATLNAWQTTSGSAYSPDNTTTWYTTNDSTIELTGLQLEVGSTATDFEHRSYGEELLLCQRYCFVTTQGGCGIGVGGGSNSVHRCQMNLPVVMRAAPSVTMNGASMHTYDGSATAQFNAFVSVHSLAHAIDWEANDSERTGGSVTAYRPVIAYIKSDSGGVICSAEL